MSETKSPAAIIEAYYAAFNARNTGALLALLTEDVAHDVNQGGRETGLSAFREFLDRMNTCYRERVEDLVVMRAADGSRAAAEFTVHGIYEQTDEGMPAAQGQSYMLPAGAFFTVTDGLIARVTSYYNLKDWLAQVEA